jgi:hypothetical protein
MVIARGAKVVIGGVGTGVLSEDLTINLQSNFKDLVSDMQNEVTDAVNVLGSAARSLSNGKIGFSSQRKEMTTQIWTRTEPAQFSLNVEFHRTLGAGLGKPAKITGANVVGVVKSFLRVPLPSDDGLLGTLVPPGPSPIEGIGIDDLIAGKSGADNVKARGIVNVQVGGMFFNRLLMRKAEPTFSKFVDDSSYPISCRVSFDFISIWAATSDMVSGW